MITPVKSCTKIMIIIGYFVTLLMERTTSRQAMFAANHQKAIGQSVVWEGNAVQRMLRRSCRLSRSARQRQGMPARYLAEGMPVIETG